MTRRSAEHQHQGKTMAHETDNTAPKTSAAADGGDGMNTYQVEEVVGLFAKPNDLQAAIDSLQMNGFDRAQVSVLGERTHVGDHQDYVPKDPSSRSIEDDANAPQEGVDEEDSDAEIKAAAVGIPIYVLGVGSLAAVIASGGTLALAMGALVLGGAAGGGLGALVAHTVGEEHRKTVKEQIENGGLVLWVQPRSRDQADKAQALLKEHHASNVHIHKINRQWGIKDVPFYDSQPDPFLERDPA